MFPCREHLPDEDPWSASWDPFTLLVCISLLDIIHWCLHTSIFIETPSLEGLPTKAKEDPSPHEMRLSPTVHQPSISWSRGIIYYNNNDNNNNNNGNNDNNNNNNNIIIIIIILLLLLLLLLLLSLYYFYYCYYFCF